jgi:benzylsuccinate CoA-transferase BbsE subunit
MAECHQIICGSSAPTPKLHAMAYTPSGRVPEGPLSGIRVVDASGPAGAYCSKLFADLGAEVILVEPPEGHALRRRGPYVDDVADAERSIPFAYFHAGKRSVRLDLDRSDGQAHFRRLASGASLVIESEMPGGMAARNLGPQQLIAESPRLVVTSITPFGQTGPYSRFAGEDLTLLAMGGLLYISGYTDLPPTRIHGYQSELMASMFSAVAALVAVMDAEATGRGQHVDVSMQECVAMALENTAPFFDLEGKVRKRTGLAQRYTGAGLFPCLDGYVYVFVGGLAAIRFWDGFVEWLQDEKAEGAERLLGPQWRERAFRESAEARDTFAAVFGPFAACRKQMDLYLEAQGRRIPMSPVSTAATVAHNPQLAARGFFVDVPHAASGRDIRMPGAPYVLSRTPWRVQRPAPRLGEHDQEVLSAS